MNYVSEQYSYFWSQIIMYHVVNAKKQYLSPMTFSVNKAHISILNVINLGMVIIIKTESILDMHAWSWC